MLATCLHHYTSNDVDSMLPLFSFPESIHTSSFWHSPRSGGPPDAKNAGARCLFDTINLIRPQRYSVAMAAMMTTVGGGREKCCCGRGTRCRLHNGWDAGCCIIYGALACLPDWCRCKKNSIFPWSSVFFVFFFTHCSDSRFGHPNVKFTECFFSKQLHSMFETLMMNL